MSIFQNAKAAQKSGETRGTVEVKCTCGNVFRARTADRRRGWGKFCSKRCKAVVQEQRTGQYSNYINGGYKHDVVIAKDRAYYEGEYGGTAQFNRNTGAYEGFTMSREELSYGGYGDADWDTPFGEGKF